MGMVLCSLVRRHISTLVRYLLGPRCASRGLLELPWASASAWELLELLDARAAAWVEPRSAPTPSASIKAKARAPIRSHLRPRPRGAGGWSSRAEAISS